MKFFYILVLISFSFSSNAADDKNGAWLGTFTKKKLSENYSLWAEAQMRFDLDENEMQQTLFRTGLLRKINAHQGLGFLYGYIETGEKSEHRFTLQHTAQYGKALGFNASHRIRLEARKFENNDFGSERFRYLLRMQRNTQRSLIPVFWNEAFVNFSEEALTGDTIFERNRLFLGFRHKTKADLDLEFGYLNQYVPRDSGDTSEHLLVLYVFM